jgi:aryl carrier-like protein
MMNLESLASAIMNTEFILNENLDELIKSGPDGVRMIQISNAFRRIACGELLMDLDLESFASNLYLSGKAYFELLKCCQRNEVDTYYQWRSHGTPLLDVITIGARKLAIDIANYSLDSCFTEQGEVEEDFYYYKLLSLLFIEPGNNKKHLHSLSKFEHALDGGFSIRHEVLTAICSNKNDAFADTFNDFLEEWISEIKNKRDNGRMDPYDDPTTANICIEGLALLRLARQHGLETEDEYLYLPKIAIEIKIRSFPEQFTFF